MNPSLSFFFCVILASNAIMFMMWPHITSFSHSSTRHAHRRLPLGLLFRFFILFFILRPKVLTERRTLTVVSQAAVALESFSSDMGLASLSAELVDMCVEALDALRRCPP